MNSSKISPDDPRLTAYALGELDATESAAVAAAIANDPAAQAAVAQIRALGGELAAALAKEPLPAAQPLANLREGAKEQAADDERDSVARKVVRSPYFWVAGLAAACFATVFVLQQRPPSSFEHQKVASASTAAASERSVKEEAESSARQVYQFDLKPDSEQARVAAMPAPQPPALMEPSAPVSIDRVEALPPLGVAAASVETSIPTALESSRSEMLSDTIQLPEAKVVGDKQGNAASVAMVPQQKISIPAPGQSGAAPTGVAAKAAAGEEVVQLGEFRLAAVRENPAKAAARRKTERQAKMVVAGDAFGQIREGHISSHLPGDAADRTTERSRDFNTEAYAYQADNAFLVAQENPLSTFSIDVDTASYANVRRFLTSGHRPPRDAVRIEELVNYFPYRYAAPKDEKPFAASIEAAAAPWNPQHRLVRIGLKGREVPESARPPMNLVFLLDVSGSMNQANKLPLVKDSMRRLVEKLKPTDRVAIVTYAGSSGLALPSTPVSQKNDILAALDDLSAGGSTNGAMGIQLAYDIAKANRIEGGANRVILCTDGDFNVGVSSDGALTRLIEEKAQSGVFLTVLGFGMGNYKDQKLELLADKGNGNYGYIDSANEAKNLLVDQVSGTLVTIAKDVKIQVEFNPALVQSYRLIGYENRMLDKEDFNNDKIDAGEIGAGHTVTALYEVVPVGVESPADAPAVDALKYQQATKRSGRAAESRELLTVKVRYKEPSGSVSEKLEFPLVDGGASFEKASEDFKFAAAVASFGMLLRESPHKGTATFESVLAWAKEGTSDDVGGHRSEFMDLVKKARASSG